MVTKATALAQIGISSVCLFFSSRHAVHTRAKIGKDKEITKDT
jgi:hypothetical protein